jgi:hypothetical protein
MQKYFIKEEIGKADKSAFNLMNKIREKLLTPDIMTAMQAGCHFDVTLRNEKDHVTIMMTSREKVSILKFPDGTPLSIIIKK